MGRRLDQVYCILVILSFCFLSTGCSDESIAIQNDVEIENYLSTNTLTAEQTENGLYYIVSYYGNVDTSRTDSVPNSSSFMQAHLVGSLLSGEEFYNSRTGDAIFADLSNSTLIDGLKTGLQFFTRGGSGILLIPSNLAYSSAGNLGLDVAVPPDVPVRFDVEVLDFYNNEAAYNDTILISYIHNNPFETDTTTAGGTYIEFITPGTDSIYPSSSSTVTLKYKTTLLNGTEIYNSLNSTITDTLILEVQYEGFKNALTLCSSGTRAIFLVPSQKALGSRSTDIIPAYAQLKYELILESIL